MTESEAYFIAHLIDGLGPVKAARLRERFGSLDKAITARGADLRGIEGIGNDMVSKITSWQETVDVEKERKWAAELGLEIVTFADPRYPASLREIYDPPLCLYIKGKIPETWPRGVALVGSRVGRSGSGRSGSSPTVRPDTDRRDIAGGLRAAGDWVARRLPVHRERR